jgi:omega-amidase
MNLRITLVQPNPVWEDKSANIAKITGMLDNIGQTDLIVLPETFSTGFTMNVKDLAETMDGAAVEWMRGLAGELHSVITGSVIISENGKYYNRLVWMTPDGTVKWYDKRHLFSMGDENLYFTPGNERITVEYKGWKIRLLVCYDLRFPVWSRNHNDYDLLIYTANWPAARHQVWKTLLCARALENQCYCIGVNRVGQDGMGINYAGDSACINSRGEATWLGDIETTHTFTLSLSNLHAFREKFPILKDRDGFILE